MHKGKPWGLRFMSNRLSAAPASYEKVALDPVTQTAQYFDATGRLLEMMGKHGTNKEVNTPSRSIPRGDGGAPPAEVTDDQNKDYVPD
ncbi:putative ATP-grasp-modified RiPP [Thermopolyspora sp. NPDC052614]|uniref:putative ATP-grasp-modified RiPP n=1 Tax=Thermopolyspora sp. NPDC052614 TaxID=3155682 RepID=UPI00343DF599